MHERAYFSINNTRVNSRAEKEIIDFFLMHKLNGEPIVVVYEPNVDACMHLEMGKPSIKLLVWVH